MKGHMIEKRILVGLNPHTHFFYLINAAFTTVAELVTHGRLHRLNHTYVFDELFGECVI